MKYVKFKMGDIVRYSNPKIDQSLYGPITYIHVQLIFDYRCGLMADRTTYGFTTKNGKYHTGIGDSLCVK